MKLDPLHYLFVDELKDLYYAETQLDKFLPELTRAATSEVLRTTFAKHHEDVKGQIERLEAIFAQIEEKPRGKKCKPMTSLIAKGKKLLDIETSANKDAALIATAQQVEHFEIAEYGTVRTYAQLLGLDGAADLLKVSLDEETAAHQKLCELAKNLDDNSPDA